MRPALVIGVMLISAACVKEPAPPPPDAGVAPVSCNAPDGCRGLDAVCRQRLCTRDVPCADDLECGLGERCVDGQCRFRGCSSSDECATGYCDGTTFSCAGCGAASDCTPERPVCHRGLRQCVQCASDADCQPPGQPHCAPSGACVACVSDAQCPAGLLCSSGNRCVGASENSPCPQGTACAEGLVCVNVNASPVCLKRCRLYEPDCVTGQLCYGLTYSTSTSLVFEADGPIGVCFAAQAGRRGLREPCVRASGGSNCQANLQCVPDTSSLALCRAYCDPLASGTCPVGEQCTSFVGDFSGRAYGLCLPDNGFGKRCRSDAVCRAGLSCQPYDDASDFDLVSGVCQFVVGDGGAGAPCSPAERQCRSGVCVADPLTPTAPYFCFGACERDGDCGDAGVCDADFLLTTAYGTTGSMRGCRVTCDAERDCAVYDAGVTCRARVSASTLTTTCSPGAGEGGGGDGCTTNAQCRSNLCVREDSRGVQRPGTCAGFCAASSCSGDAGFAMTCAPTALFLSGSVVTRAMCSGVACTVDAECGSGVCSLQRDALDGGALVHRCAAATTGVKRGGDACLIDAECRSGVCGEVSTVGRTCFEACDATTTCAPSTTCRVAVLAVTVGDDVVHVDSCAP